MLDAAAHELEDVGQADANDGQGRLSEQQIEERNVGFRDTVLGAVGQVFAVAYGDEEACDGDDEDTGIVLARVGSR